MKKYKVYLLAGTLIVALAVLLVALPASFAAKNKAWHFNGTVIEACSCPMFCQCYFNTKPALHKTNNGAERFCKFNMAYKINKGYYGDTDLSGVRFWVAGDLGGSWKNGDSDWAIVTFQSGTTDEQKAGVAAALGHIFPLKWKSFQVAEDEEIEWKATEDRAEAKLAKGVRAHIILNKWKGMEGKTGVLENIAYMGAPRNNGFKMMPNEIETWKVGDQSFEFKGTTGFMITVDMKSEDLSM
ncbi:MAG: DUF1326 domain-containing protein [Desulfobacteraceae bacterium]